MSVLVFIDRRWHINQNTKNPIGGQQNLKIKTDLFCQHTTTYWNLGNILCVYFVIPFGLTCSTFPMRTNKKYHSKNKKKHEKK